MTALQPTPPSTIYLAAAEPGTGKSTIALGLVHLLAASAGRVGVFRPVVRSLDEPDGLLELLLAHATATLREGTRCVGVTYQQVHADPAAALSQIVAGYHEVANQCDAVVVVGSDYTDVVNPTELAFNARVAVNVGAPLLLAVNGHDRTPETVAAITGRCVTELGAVHAGPAAVVVNRCDPARLEAVAAALDETGLPVFALPEVPLLAAPTMAELCEALDGSLYSGDPELLRREAISVMVGGMTAEHILERLVEGQVVIVPADRSEVLLALVNAHTAAGFPSLAGIILNGGLLPHPAIDKLVKGLQPTLPLIATGYGTYRTAELASHTRARIDAGALRKVDTALEMLSHHIDVMALVERMQAPESTIVTPQMFEYRLLERARADRRHIVLPEGDDDRILLAAGRLLARGIVDLTILGSEQAVRRRGAELGVDLAGAAVLEPQSSGLLEKFGAEYARLRAHKGISEEQAREIVCDVSYFGTMMVHLGIADIDDELIHRDAPGHRVTPASDAHRSRAGGVPSRTRRGAERIRN